MKYDQGIKNLDDVHHVITSETKPSTKKFEFFTVEKFGHFRKLTSDSREHCKIPGIMSLHSLKLSDDRIILNQFTCTDCINDDPCGQCKQQKVFLNSKLTKPECIQYIEVDEQNDDDDDSDDENDRIHDDDDNGHTDDESEIESEDEEEQPDEVHAPGEIIWALYGNTWYPAKICSLAEVPEENRSKFSKLGEKLIVKWVGEEKFSPVSVKHIDELGENLVDAKRAARSKNIMERYNRALGLKLSSF